MSYSEPDVMISPSLLTTIPVPAISRRPNSLSQVYFTTTSDGDTRSYSFPAWSGPTSARAGPAEIARQAVSVAASTDHRVTNVIRVDRVIDAPRAGVKWQSVGSEVRGI